MNNVNDANDITFSIDLDQVPSYNHEQTPSIGLWGTIKAWGRKIIPTPKILTGTIATTAFVASAFFLLQQNRYTHFTPTTERTIEAICWTSLGTSTRTMIELLASTDKDLYSALQQIHNTTTGLAHWCFYALWNISLNVEDEALKKTLYGVISTLFGYNLVHDCIQALKSMGHSFIDLDENKKNEEESSLFVEDNDQQLIINNDNENNDLTSQSTPLLLPAQPAPSLLLEPLFTDTKKVLLYQVIKVICGGTAVFLNNYQNHQSDLYLIANTLGYILIGSGIGEIGMEGLTHLQKKMDECASSSSNSNYPKFRKWGAKVLNPILETAPIMIIELNMLFRMFDPGNNGMGILIGVSYGKKKYDAKKGFQQLTADTHLSKKRNNQVLQSGCWKTLKKSKACQLLGLVEKDRRLKPGILFDRIITIPLFLGLTGFTIAVCLDTNSTRQQIAISTLLISALGMTGASALLKKFFKPGKNSRVLNEFYFNFFENEKFLPLIYSILTQMGGIDDKSISKHNDLQFAFSLLGMAAFGSLLGIVRVESGDSYRNPTIYTSPIYRMSSWLTLVMLFKGQTSSSS